MTELLVTRVVGTFLKVVPYGFDKKVFNDESLSVLYIRQSGVFLFIGYWQGYELTVAAGNWHKDEDRLALDGVGALLSSDTWPYPKGLREFQRQFMIQRQIHTPVLVAEDELKGWSLIGCQGPLTYVGEHRFIEIKDNRMPESWSDIDGWIDKFTGAT